MKKELWEKIKDNIYEYEFESFVIGVFLSSVIGISSYILLRTIISTAGALALSLGLLSFVIEIGLGYVLCRNYIFRKLNTDILRFFEYMVCRILTTLLWELLLSYLSVHNTPFVLAAFSSITVGNVLFFLLCKFLIFDDKREKFNLLWAMLILFTVLMLPLSVIANLSAVSNIVNSSKKERTVKPTEFLLNRSSSDELVHSSELNWGENLVVTIDDRWFFEDLSVYNDDLAFNAVLLSKMSYLENDIINKKTDISIEDCFGNLGFDWVSSSSYKYRSKFIDKFANVIDGESYGSPYLIAGKTIFDEEGNQKNLIVISITGSLNFDLLDDLLMGINNDYSTSGHKSFTSAARELVDALLANDEVINDDTVVLFTGHSRGASIANVASAYLIEGLQKKNIDAEVVAYLYATANCEGSKIVERNNYDTIFNILNPYDIVPHVPFCSLGFSRYGKDVYLYMDELTDDDIQYIVERAGKYAGKNYRADISTSTSYFEMLDKMEEYGFENKDNFISIKSALDLYDIITDIDIFDYIAFHYTPVYISFIEALR